MTTYYDPQGFALEIFRKRYSLHESETWQEACDRVANHVAAAERGEAVVEYRQRFAELLKTNVFMPGGRIWYGSGRPRGQLLNCFVVPTSDSREGWGDTCRDVLIISGTGGGVGVNCSPVRHRGSPINGTGGTATGAVSLMRIINAIGEQIKAGGGRRTALMLCLNSEHGDIDEFLSAKLDHSELNNANISVVFNENPEEFFQRVKKGNVTAKAMWTKIVANALKGGEPGLLNMFYGNRMSNIWYYKPLICTNPCGEIQMIEYDCCCLGALVLPRFVDASKGIATINFDALKSITKLSVRFLDNVLSVNNYPLPQIAETCSNIRRIGLGVMGLHDMLLLMGLKYNSDAGLELVHKVMGVIKNAAYEASTDLASEKGSFPKFEMDKFLKSRFIKTLKPSIRSAIREKGIRNCALLTIAPTGTTSLVCDVTSGIEPMFSPAYVRRYRDGEKLASEVLIHPLFKKFIEEGRPVKHFQGAFDIKLRDHFEMQRVCQEHLDNACSKTINLPQGTSEDELSELYMEFFPELKGVTVYPEGSREDQPLTPMTLEEATKHAKTTVTTQAYAKDTCKSGSCDI